MRFWWILLPCPLLAGCFAYVFPEISQTPSVALSAEGVRAFRIRSEITMSGPWMTGPINYGGSAEEISLVDATVGPQRDASLDYYYLVFPVNGSRARTLNVSLYRPGYETVVIAARPWWQGTGSGRPEEVTWKEAPGLEAQKAALDLIAPEGNGVKMLATNDLLQFVAREYARLADSPSPSTKLAETRKELLALAKKFEGLAMDRKP